LSYSALDRSAVYNASVLGARLLTRVSEQVNDPTLLAAAKPLVSYVLARQRHDGSWGYGEARHHHWVDSFHTGFLLGALDLYRRTTNDLQVEAAIIRGAEHWQRTFFGGSGEPYYYAHRRYPLDVHSAAQAIITFLQLRDLFPSFVDSARRTARWMTTNLMNPDGSFCYQVRRGYRVHTRYMRWSQAWATRALAEMAWAEVDW
jgi:hypothetical protein